MRRRTERMLWLVWVLILAACFPASGITETPAFSGPLLPAVYLTVDEKDLYDAETGILAEGILAGQTDPGTGEIRPANYMMTGEDWVRPAEAVIVSSSGEILLRQTVGVAVSGGTSRGYARPSLKLIADAWEEDAQIIYTGLNRLEYSLLSNVEKYHDLKLHTGSQDAGETNIRAAVMSRICEDCGFPGYLPEERAVLWLNGAFYALCSVQPRYIRSWIGRRFSLADNSRIEIIGDSEAMCMQGDGLAELFECDLNLPENRETLEQKVDMTDYLRYVAIQVLSNNVDWPGNNFRMWRYTGEEDPDNPWSDGRYRCLIYDSDLIWLHKGYLTGIFGEDTFRLVLENDVMSEGVKGHKSWIGNVLQATVYRDRFVNIVEDLLHTAFRPERLKEIMEEEAERIRESVLRYQGEDAWKQNRLATDLMEGMAADTRRRVEQDIGEYLQLRDQYSLTLINAEGITLELNGRILKSGEKDAWDCYLHTETEILAEANPGTRFIGWLVNGERREDALLRLDGSVVRDGQCVVESLSEPVETCLMIAEIRAKGQDDWIRLTNAGKGTLDLGGYRISDEESFRRAEALPGVLLESGESVLLVGKKSAEAGGYRLTFNLSEGEALCLWNAKTGDLADRMTVPRMSEGETYGQEPGSSRRVFFRNGVNRWREDLPAVPAN